MTLGFTVDALVRAGRGGGALRMGLSRVPAADWLWPAVDRAARAAAFAEHPDAVCALAGAGAAQREAAAVIASAVTHPLQREVAARGADGRVSPLPVTPLRRCAPPPLAGEELSSLALAAHGTWEDLCILERDASGRFVLTAAAVGFPTDWRLGEKMGLPVAAIHAPIHGYAGQLSAGVDHFLDTLVAGPVFGRANWFIVANDDWRYMPDADPAARFAHVTADNAGETLFVRCERQTLRKLPDTGAVLFTIGVAVARLDTLLPDTVARVAAGIAAQPDGEQGRKAAPFYADALADYAARHSNDRLEAAE